MHNKSSQVLTAASRILHSSAQSLLQNQSLTHSCPARRAGFSPHNHTSLSSVNETKHPFFDRPILRSMQSSSAARMAYSSQWKSFVAMGVMLGVFYLNFFIMVIGVSRLPSPTAFLYICPLPPSSTLFLYPFFLGWFLFTLWFLSSYCDFWALQVDCLVAVYWCCGCLWLLFLRNTRVPLEQNLPGEWSEYPA